MCEVAFEKMHCVCECYWKLWFLRWWNFVIIPSIGNWKSEQLPDFSTLNASVADLIHMYRNINVWQRFPCITLLISRTQVHTRMYFLEMSVKAYLFVVVMCMHNAHVCRFWELVAYTNIK